MNMQQYLAEVRHAVETTLTTVWADLGALNALAEDVRRLTERTHAEYGRVDAMLSVDPDDDDGVATAHHWDTYFGVDRERFYRNKSLEELTQSIDLKRFSLNVLAGSVLQIGKQGMSIVNSGLAASRAGRQIATLPLKDVIWQARNQAMHWEEGRLSQAVHDCFAALVVVDAKFADYRAESMAFYVVRLLGWTNFDAFAADMTSLSA